MEPQEYKRHTCEHCTTGYEIPDAKVAGRFLKVRCKRCQGTMHVVGIRPLDTVADGALWWCAFGNQALGPFRRDEVFALIEAGSVHARTRMWQVGMDGWQRVCESSKFAWVYSEILERCARSVFTEDATDPTYDGFPSSIFDVAALRGEGADTSSPSGIILFNGEPPGRVEPHTRARGTRAESTSLLAPILAAAVGAGAAMGGVLWFVLGATA